MLEIGLAVVALAALGAAYWAHTAKGKAELATVIATLKGDIASAHAKFDAFVAGFHLGASQPSTPVVADPAPVAPPAAPVAPPVAPPAAPVAAPVVTISGSPGDITSLLFPKPTAPSVVPAQPAPPAVVLDPRVIYYNHNTFVAADGPYTPEALKPGKNTIVFTYTSQEAGHTAPNAAWMSEDNGQTWQGPMQAAAESDFTTTGVPAIFKFDTNGRMQAQLRNF